MLSTPSGLVDRTERFSLLTLKILQLSKRNKHSINSVTRRNINKTFGESLYIQDSSSHSCTSCTYLNNSKKNGERQIELLDKK